MMSPNLGQHCVSLRHRRVPDTPNLYQLLPTSTNQPKRTGTLAKSFCVLAQTTLTKLPTCRESPDCRVVLDTLADTTSSLVGDMTETCRDMSPTRHRMSPFGQQNRHADIRHVELSWSTWLISSWFYQQRHYSGHSF